MSDYPAKKPLMTLLLGLQRLKLLDVDPRMMESCMLKCNKCREEKEIYSVTGSSLYSNEGLYENYLRNKNIIESLSLCKSCHDKELILHCKIINKDVTDRMNLNPLFNGHFRQVILQLQNLV